MTAGARSYEDAIKALNTLQSNASVIAQIRADRVLNADKIMPETVEYLERAGMKPSDLNALNVIHITGTKGKGSTTAFCDAMLRQLAPSAKIGMYTSPHLVAVRERIRLNGSPLSESAFARYFFEIWDQYGVHTQRRDEAMSPLRPGYARFLTIMAFHVFLRERVDAAIVEVGIGGTYDATNVVPQPLATGVSALGYDHTAILGKTLTDIAHQKAGIFKAGVPAISVEQPEEGATMLAQRAVALKASSYSVVPVDESLRNLKLGLAGAHQRSNASLALGLVRAFLASERTPEIFRAAQVDLSPSASLDDRLRRGLETVRWAGRCQIAVDPAPERRSVTYYLDGAHTVESLAECGKWFMAERNGSSSSGEPRPTRVLIFNCTFDRTPEELLGSLVAAAGDLQIDQAIFCPNTTYRDGSKGDLTSLMYDPAEVAALKAQNTMAQVWRSLHPDSSPRVLPSIEDAIALVQALSEDGARPVDVLVTGSLHLVGGVMSLAKLPTD